MTDHEPVAQVGPDIAAQRGGQVGVCLADIGPRKPLPIRPGDGDKDLDEHLRAIHGLPQGAQ